MPPTSRRTTFQRVTIPPKGGFVDTLPGRGPSEVDERVSFVPCLPPPEPWNLPGPGSWSDMLPAPVWTPPLMPASATTAVPAQRPHWWARLKDWLHRFFRRLAYLFGPILATAAVWGLVRWQTTAEFAREVYIAGSASLLGAGTTIVLGKAVVGDTVSLGVWQLAFIVMWVNAASTFWYTYNLDLFERLPKVGPTLRQMREDAVATLRERPWIRRLSVVGVGAFVVTPLPGSGALGGAIVGRLVGVSKFATFVSVSIAGVIVSSAYALFADKLQEWMADIPTWVRITGAVVMIVAIFLLVRWWRRRRAARETDRAQAREDVVTDAPTAVQLPTPVVKNDEVVTPK